MKTRPMLLALARVIADECDHNAPFRKKVEEVLTPPKRAPAGSAPVKEVGKPHRRLPAAFDPIVEIKYGEEQLRGRLQRLTIEQLKDIVAEYGMDPSKLVMKWKDSDRIVDRIVESSAQRAAKGDAFRN